MTALPRHETVIDVPGGRIWAETLGRSEVRAGGGAVQLVLLHGGPGFSHYSFEPLLALASERPVVWYDQLGSGRSERPSDPSLWRVERFVEELDVLRGALGLDQVHILGHSWGTMLLAAYLATEPEGIVSAVFSSPCLDARRWTADQQLYLTALPQEQQRAIALHDAGQPHDRALYDAGVQEYNRRHLCRLDPWPDPVRRDIAAVNLEVYETMWGPTEFTATGTLREFDATPWLPSFDVPTLFTCGGFDEATPSSTAHFASLVPGARTHVFERSGHLSYVEEPEEYRRVIGSFLREAEHA